MMMGADEARESLWSYQAKLWHWNDRHATDENAEDGLEAPSTDWFEHRMMVLKQKGVIH